MGKLLTILALVFVLTGCRRGPPLKSYHPIPYEGKVYYAIIEIEGMPCVTWADQRGNSGITCDWSQYRGNDE